MKEFGLQAYSVRDHLDTKENLAATFKELAAMGYSSIHSAVIHHYPAEFLKQAADEAGLIFCGTHYPWDRVLNDVELTIAEHEILGTKNIGIGGMPPEARNDLAGLNKFIDEFNAAVEIYSARGFKLTYHNHSFEFRRLEDGRTLFDHLMERFDPEKVSFVLDTYWCQHAGIDVRAMIEKLAGRIDILHLKDMEAAYNFKLEDGATLTAPRITEVGNGNINFKDIIPLAEKCGVKYFVVEDDRAPMTGDSMGAVKKSADYIKANLLEK